MSSLPARSMAPKRVGALLLGIVTMLGCATLPRMAPALTPPTTGTADTAGDAFHSRLFDQRGRVVRIADFKGRPVVITFVATRCTDGCPIANAAFAALDRRLQRDHIAAELLTITLDPEHDSPLSMGRLAANFGADGSRWRFLSGAPGDVRKVMRAFGVQARPGVDGIPEEHTSFVYLLDAHGRPLRNLLLSTNLGDEVTAIVSHNVVRSAGSKAAT